MSLTGSRFSSDSAPRPFHHGDSKARWNNLSGGLAVNMTAGPSGQTISPHPSSREGHHSTARWSLDLLLSHLTARSSGGPGSFQWLESRAGSNAIGGDRDST